MAARPRIWERLGERQRRRYARQGVTPSYYESGGRLQRFRGHKEKEHVTRRQNKPEGLTGTDYRFLKRQQIRSGSDIEEWAEFIEWYKSLSPGNRELARSRVTSENADWRRRGKKVLRKIDEYIRELQNDYPWFTAGMVALMFYH